MSGRIRTIKPELLEDDKTAALEHDEFRLFVALIVLADDYGNSRGNPTWLEGQVFWASKPSRDTREVLARLSKVGLVTLYTVSGQPYAHLNGWDKHQKVDHPSKPRVPGPNEADSTPPPEPSRKARETLASDSRLTSDLRSPIPTSDPDHERTPAGAAAPAPHRESEKPEAEEVFSHWQRTMMPGAKRSTQRMTRIRARLKEGFTPKQLCSAVDGAAKDPFLMGTDPKSRPGGYRDIETVLRDAAQVERLMALAAGKVRPIATAQDSEPDPRIEAEKRIAQTNALLSDGRLKHMPKPVRSAEPVEADKAAVEGFLAGFGRVP